MFPLHSLASSNTASATTTGTAVVAGLPSTLAIAAGYLRIALFTHVTILLLRR